MEINGFGRSAASPSLTSPPLLIATPSDVVVSRETLERVLVAMFDWGARCQKQRSFIIVTDTGSEAAADHLMRNALHVLGVKASQAPVASDGEVRKAPQALQTTEPKDPDPQP